MVVVMGSDVGVVSVTSPKHKRIETKLLVHDAAATPNKTLSTDV